MVAEREVDRSAISFEIILSNKMITITSFTVLMAGNKDPLYSFEVNRSVSTQTRREHNRDTLTHMNLLIRNLHSCIVTRC